MAEQPLDLPLEDAEDLSVTTSTATETTGDTIVPGDIIGLTDYIRDEKHWIVAVVHEVHDAGRGMFLLDVTGVVTDRYWAHEPLVVTVADREPVTRYGHMDPNDWSADYARRAFDPIGFNRTGAYRPKRMSDWRGMDGDTFRTR